MLIGSGPSSLSKSESSIVSRGCVSITSNRLSASKSSKLVADEPRLFELLTSRRGIERCGPRDEAAGTEAGMLISWLIMLLVCQETAGRQFVWSSKANPYGERTVERRARSYCSV